MQEETLNAFVLVTNKSFSGMLLCTLIKTVYVLLHVFAKSAYVLELGLYAQQMEVYLQNKKQQ